MTFLDRLMVRSADATSEASRTPKITKLNYARYAYRPRLVSQNTQAAATGEQSNTDSFESFVSMYQIYDRSAQTSMDLIDPIVERVIRKKKMNETTSLKDINDKDLNNNNENEIDKTKSLNNVTIGALSNLLILPLMAAASQNSGNISTAYSSPYEHKKNSIQHLPIKSNIRSKNGVSNTVNLSKHTNFLDRTSEASAERESTTVVATTSSRKSSLDKSNLSDGSTTTMTETNQQIQHRKRPASPRKKSIKSRLEVVNSSDKIEMVSESNCSTRSMLATSVSTYETLKYIDKTDDDESRTCAASHVGLGSPETASAHSALVGSNSQQPRDSKDPSFDDFKRLLTQNKNLVVNWDSSCMETSDYL
jgi:hypothetical protein